MHEPDLRCAHKDAVGSDLITCKVLESECPLRHHFCVIFVPGTMVEVVPEVEHQYIQRSGSMERTVKDTTS